MAYSIPGLDAAPRAFTLTELNKSIQRLLNVAELREVWVTAELSDLRTSGGHYYMELLEKSPNDGSIKARIKGIMWGSNAARLRQEFYVATGQQFATGLSVMVRGSVNYHASFGISFIISAINPEFTIGSVERRRREILQRLEREGILDSNRTLPWPLMPSNIAIISAQGAAGYGDFIHQLYSNPHHLRFTTRLFQATMQGDNTVASVINALDQIAADDCWDAVVIIRGGGATSDLVSFDSYELAANIAQFPIPVVVGIGHERDITVLDYVANMRVKTPTAAAEWLINRGAELLATIRQYGVDISREVRDKLNGALTQLAYIEGNLPTTASSLLQQRYKVLNTALLQLTSLREKKLRPALSHLDRLGSALPLATAHRLEKANGTLDTSLKDTKQAIANIMDKRQQRLAAIEEMIVLLSPEATLRRGYSITRINNQAITSITQIEPTAIVETMLADGSFVSTVVSIAEAKPRE
ncbi:MAG: exodeoxyribonuclease VII large subunit [Bacteroidales bacterium]|nr:exodeoxyribonuclease VII large subunit [Bacteroidales bacterium]